MRAMLVAALFLLPMMAPPALACGGVAQATATDLSAQTKKPVKKAVKIKKKKIEYMRAAPMK